MARSARYVTLPLRWGLEVFDLLASAFLIAFFVCHPL
jgi:hypothetical protein